MTLSVKKRNEIILNSKKIISYFKNGCNLEKSLFNKQEDILQLINEIKQYGDISSVRRAIKLYNEKYKTDIKYEISDEIKYELETKKKIKELSIPTIQVKYGKFILDFV
tara:strand:- start:908 stop:1234 length:327 start_codon:yes stop_codon:yes gene_type:complete